METKKENITYDGDLYVKGDVEVKGNLIVEGLLTTYTARNLIVYNKIPFGDYSAWQRIKILFKSFKTKEK